MVFSIIQKSQLEGAHRLDAEYYQPEYLGTRRLIASIEHVLLGEISSKFKKGIFDIKAGAYSNEGVPFIRISNLKNGLIDDQEIAFIPPKINQSESGTILCKGDIVLSKTACPAASLVTFDQVNISQDIIGVSLKNDWQNKILSPFIVAFLNSKFGILEMQQWFQGNIQMHLALPDAKTILIPLLPLKLQREIATIFLKAEEDLRNSKTFYSQAEDLLLEELRLKDFQFEDDLSFVVNRSDVQSANRVDAEYFQPKYERLLNFIPRKVTIGELQKFNKRGVQPQYIEGGEIKVVTSKHLGQNSIDYDNLDRTTIEEWKRNPQARINPLDILIYTTGANVGRTNCYLEDDKVIASNHVNILRVDKLNHIYTAVYLNSILGQAQVKKSVSGSAQVELYPSDISKFIVWDAPKELQQKIAELVRKSHEARKESKELLEEAKRKVEEMIEKGG